MRSLRFGLVSLGAAIVLSACSGGAVPSPSAAFAPNLADGVATPCTGSPLLTWRFHGACAKAPLPAAGATVTLKPYKGVVVSIAFGSNTATGKAAIVLGDAKGGKDITGTKPFPLYGTKTCQQGQNCVGKRLVYVELLNASKSTVSFNGSTEITVSANKFPGTNCFIANFIQVKGVAGGWFPSAPIVPPVGGKVAISVPGSGLFKLSPGSTTYFALVCAP